MRADLFARLVAILRKPKRGCVRKPQPASKPDGQRVLVFLALVLVLIVAIPMAVIADSPHTETPTKDNYIYQNSSLTNYGAATFVSLYDRTSRAIRILLEFDITDIPEGVTIDTATLSLYYYDRGANDPVGRTIWAYKLTRTDWAELTSCWQWRYTSTAWTTWGGDYVTSDPSGDSAVYPADLNTWVDWDVKAILEDAIANELSVVEILLRCENEAQALYSWTYFYSRDYTTDPSKQPKLVIEYTSTIAPTVVTNNETDVSYTWGYVCANITDTGGANATIRGFQWGTGTGNYTSSWNETGDYGISEYCHNITGLGCNETYYFRGFATNEAGTGYGAEETFTTTDCSAPTVDTLDATDISYTYAYLNGNVTATGGPDSTTRGFEYDIDSGAPYAYDWHEDGTFGTGEFAHNVTTLTEGTPYYFRAYATGPGGTGYGDEVAFNTTDCTPPSVATYNATDVEYTTATLNGGITDPGSLNATTRGFEWDIDSGAPYANNWTEAGSFGSGNFTHDLIGLTDGIPYYYRVLATNLGGTTYGDEITFNTTAYTAPVVTSSAATNITLHTAIVYGNVTAIGGQNVTTRGFDWGYATGNYTQSWNATGGWGTGEFTHTLTGLTSGAEVYWLAWAINPEGQGNSTELSFTVGQLPSAPGNFTIEHGLLDIYVITWDTGARADITLVVGNEDHYPTNPTDGYVLYSGNGTTCTMEGVNPDLEMCYFRAWSENTYGYSVNYAEDTIGNAINLTAIIFIVGIAGFALWKKGWLRILLSISLIIFGAASASYDIKVAAPLLGLGMILFIMATMHQVSIARQGGEA